MADLEQPSSSVITLDEESQESENTGLSQRDFVFNWYSQPQLPVDSDITQAHAALTTAYNSLKTRLIKSEAENNGLKRELRSMNAHKNDNGRNSPRFRNHTSPGHDFITNGSSILRQKQNGARFQDESTSQKHGSWGYSNDHNRTDRTEGHYVQLLEVQLIQVEEERNRLQTELKDVRVKLSEQMLKSDQLKSKDNHCQCNVQAHVEIEQRHEETKSRLHALSNDYNLLLKNYKQLKCEEEILLEKIVSLDKKLADMKASCHCDPETVTVSSAAADNVVFQQLTDMISNSNAKLSQARKTVAKQQHIIQALQKALGSSTKGTNGHVRGACQTDDCVESASLIRQAVGGDSSPETNDFGQFYTHGANQVNGLTNNQAGMSPSSPSKSPKRASQHTFGYDPIKIQQHRLELAGDSQIKVNHTTYNLDNGEYIGVADDAYREARQPSPYNDVSRRTDRHEASFHIEDDARTITHLRSEDIKINLEPQAELRPTCSSRLNVENGDNPPPSPCRKVVTAEDTRRSSPSPPSASSHARHTSPHATETSAASSDDVPVRRPTDMARTYDHTSNTEHRDDVIRAAGEIPPNVARLSAPKSASRLHASQSFNNKHYRRENMYVDPHRLTGANSYSQRELDAALQARPRIQSSTDLDVRPKLLANPTGAGAIPKRSSSATHVIELQEIGNTTDWRHRQAQNSPAGLHMNEYTPLPKMNTDPGNFFNNIAFDVGAAGYYPPRSNGIGMVTSDAARPSVRRKSPVSTDQQAGAMAGNVIQPVENEENESVREKTTSAGDAKCCMICSKPFPAASTLKDKEAHINACLAENTSVPETPECPVCKRIFPPDYPEDQRSEHVNRHFDEGPVDLDRYVFVE